MTIRRKLILALRWHRRLGLFAAIFVLFLSVTGLMLNHTEGLKLDSTQLHSPSLARWYGLPELTPVGFQLDQQWWIHDGQHSLYLNLQEIAQCPPPLLGVASLDMFTAVLCQDELLLVADGELVERITPVYGLPSGSNALAVTDNELWLRAAEGQFIANLDSLEWQSVTADQQINWVTSQPIPKQLKEKLAAQGPGISLEQFILDLHSGRLFGKFGVYVVDFVAIVLIILGFTGVIAWVNYHRLRRRS